MLYDDASGSMGPNRLKVLVNRLLSVVGRSNSTVLSVNATLAFSLLIFLRYSDALTVVAV